MRKLRIRPKGTCLTPLAVTQLITFMANFQETYNLLKTVFSQQSLLLHSFFLSCMPISSSFIYINITALSL